MESLRKKRQKKWLGHVLRHDSLLQKVIEGRFQGKKTPGRPRTMLLDALMQEDEESVIDYTKLKEKAHNRETCRQWERTCLWAENTINPSPLCRTCWLSRLCVLRTPTAALATPTDMDSRQLGDVEHNVPVLSPVSIQTQSLALRALRLDGNRAFLRWQAANHGCHCFDRASYWLQLPNCKQQPIGCLVEAVATMIGCLPTKAFAFSPVSIQTQRTQRKRLRLDGNRALRRPYRRTSRLCYTGQESVLVP